MMCPRCEELKSENQLSPLLSYGGSIESDALLNYWWDRLLDEDYSAFELPEPSIELSWYQIQKLQASFDAFSSTCEDRLIRLYKARRRTRGEHGDSDVDLTPDGKYPRDVALVFGWPDPARSIATQPARGNLSPVFYVPLQLKPTGELEHVSRPPRFVRHWLLEQPAGTQRPSLGGFAKYSAEILKRVWPEIDSIEEFIRESVSVYQAVTKSQVETHRYPGDRSGALLTATLAIRAPGSVSAQLNKSYRRLIQLCPDHRPELVRQLIDGPGATISVQTLAEPSLDKLSRHIGAAESLAHESFGLNRSQRRVLHGLKDIDGFGIVAVNGPPGTGKTTMLRTIIADAWTAAAANGAASPPVIVACGATNQSVMNVLGIFDGVLPATDEPDGSSHTRRWLRETNIPYIAYLPSKLRRGELADGDEYALIDVLWLKNSNGKKAPPIVAFDRNIIGGYDSRTLERIPVAVLLKAAKAFIDNFLVWAKCDTPLQHDLSEYCLQAEIDVKTLSNASNGVGLIDVSTAYRELRSALENIASALRACIRQCNEQGDLVRLSAATRDNATVAEPFDSEERALDKTWRTRAFHLAARYWEARWLIEVSRTRHTVSQLQRTAMLAPCTIATLFTVPKLNLPKNLYSDPTESSHTTPPIDLLVIDEAGQARPELLAPVLSFAKRAIVVGDVKQLAPVSGTEPNVDRTIAGDYCKTELRASAQWANKWESSGKLVSSGSTMRLATNVASVHEVSRNGVQRAGLLLRDHYRCVDPIIHFCIDLKYNEDDDEPELRPSGKRNLPGSFDDIKPFECLRSIGDTETAEWLRQNRFVGHFPLPALGFFQVGIIDSKPETYQESWRSEAEARAISHWISANAERLCLWLSIKAGKELKLEDVLAILTPFRAQANKIRAVLDPRYQSITIGTAHTMQGAERPVILFSAVNDRSQATSVDADPAKKVFIDRDHGNLLNVAVSRARDAFILFGHPDLFFSRDSLNTSNNLPSAILGRRLAGITAPGDFAREPGVRIGPEMLIAVESENKAGKISRFLPPQIQVFATNGHIRDLQEHDKKNDVKASAEFPNPDNDFKPQWELSLDKDPYLTEKLDKISSRLIQLPVLILATDPDAEGEAIAWHLRSVLSPHIDDSTRILRCVFSHVGERDVLTALCSPRALNEGLALTAIARRVTDAMIGSWWRSTHFTRGGRVRAPLYRALSDNVKDDGAPDPVEWIVLIDLSVGNKRIRASLIDHNTGEECVFVGEGARQRAIEASSILRRGLAIDGWALDQSKARSTLLRVKPMSTAEILRLAWRRYRLSTDETMAVLRNMRLQPEACSSRNVVLSADPEPCIAPISKSLLLPFHRSPEISSIEFARFVEAACESVEADAYQLGDIGAYKKAIRIVAERLYGHGNFNVSPPDEPAASEAESPFDRGNRRRPAWPAVSSGLDRELGDRCLELLTSKPQPNRFAAALRLGADNAHPPLMPRNMRVDPAAANQAFGSNSAAGALYTLLWNRAISTVMRPARISRKRATAASPDARYRIAVNIVNHDLNDRDWFLADPCALLEYIQDNGIESADPLLASGAAVANVAVRRRDLKNPSISGLLSFLVTHKLGRPSTYHSHVKDFEQKLLHDQ